MTKIKRQVPPATAPKPVQTKAGHWSPVIFNQIDDGLVVVDDQNRIIAFNQAASQLTGWSIDPVYGLELATVVVLQPQANHDYQAGQHPFELAKARESSAPVRFSSYLQPRPPATIIPLVVTVSPLENPVDPAGQNRAWLIVLRDQTEEHDRNQAKTDFVSTASHEMRTPLATIEGYLALAGNDQICRTDEQARNYINQARTAVLTLSNLFKDLLLASQSEDGSLTNHPELINLAKFLNDLIDGNDFGHQAKGLELKLNLESAAAAPAHEKQISPEYLVYADPRRLSELIINIIDNAVKYSQTGTIGVALTGSNQTVTITVSDQGLGIPAQDLPHLFQKFYRVDNNSQAGTGLGLFICKQIVDLYGGKIWAESQLGQGSQIKIELPRVDRFLAAKLARESAGPGS